MSSAFRCDITGDCIAADESPNTYWTIRAGTTTILGKPNVEVSLNVEVTIPDVEGVAHMSQAARNAVMAKIKQYFESL